MVELGVLGNRIQICIAPASKKGMYLRNSSGMPRHTKRQTMAQRALAGVASSMFDQNKSPGEIRAAIQAQCSGHNKYGGAAALEAKRQARHQAALAFARGGAVPIEGSAAYAGGLPGLF